MSYYGGYGSQEEWDSEYDSTWEDDEDGEQPMSERRKNVYQSNRHKRAAKDSQRYRRGYPDVSPKLNLQFYQNEIPFRPYGAYIDDMHTFWRYEYDTLEKNHNFIQWLFPIRERGVNPQAAPLTLSEIQLMKKDGQVMERILESYKLMLGFYGIELLDPETGTVGRAEGNWEERFDNLNNNTHNNLRITRILKCLGEMGYEKFQAPLVKFFLEETLCNGNLPRVKESALDYFMFIVKDKKERQKLVHFAWVNYKPQDEFIWGPVEKLRKLDRLLQTEAEHEVNNVKESTIQMNESVSDSEGSGNEPAMNDTGYIFKPVHEIISFLFNLFHSPLTFWSRGEVRNEDREIEGQYSVKREGSKTEKTMDANMMTVKNLEEDEDKSEKAKPERLWKDHERQESSKAEPKKQDVSDHSIEYKAKLETRDNGSKCESVPDFGTGSEDQNPLFVKKMPETRPGKEDDSATENEGDSGKASQSKNGMKVDEDATSGNESLEGAEGGTEKEDNTEKSENSDTKDSRTDNCGGDREADGTQTANAGNQCWETKRYDLKPEDEGAHNGGEWGKLESLRISEPEDNRGALAMGSKNTDGGNIGAQTREPEKGKTEQVDKEDKGAEDGIKKEYNDTENGGNSNGHTKHSRTDSHGGDRKDGETQILHTGNQLGETKIFNGNTEDKGVSSVEQFPPFGRGEHGAENARFSKTEGNRKALTGGPKDNDGGNIGILNTLPETDKTEPVESDDGKNVELFTLLGEGYKDDNADLSNTEDNRRALSLRSKDKDGKNIGAHTTEPEKYKTVDQHRADVSSNSETDEGMNEAGQSVDESVETADCESYKVDNKQEDDRTTENKLV